MPKSRNNEGLKMARLLMVLSSISPLFILWAIRGNTLVPEYYFFGFCAAMVILPNLFLWLRIHTAQKLNEQREITIGSAEDHRDHLLVYLFAMLLPFYSADMCSWREVVCALTALGFIIYLFYHLNLHYMNIAFAAKGYRVFTVYPPNDDNPISGKTSLVLITKHVSLFSGQKINAYRLSNTVYFERN